jgi:SAM-dependent methyltransferase
VGCGNGGFLKLMREEIGCRCHGVDISASSVAEARRAGVSAETADVEAAWPTQERFDLICLWHVLEHFRDPVRVLKRLRGHIRPRGYLAIGVPDVEGLAARLFGDAWFGCDVPRHLHHFSRPTLRLALERSGWRLAHCEHITECSTLCGSLHNVLRRRWCDDLPGHLVRWSLLQGLCLPLDHLLRLAGQGDWLFALARAVPADHEGGGNGT